ncbi:hypothetical protein J0S82_009892, partial [Galemys pyrenaicus]
MNADLKTQLWELSAYQQPRKSKDLMKFSGSMWSSLLSGEFCLSSKSQSETKQKCLSMHDVNLEYLVFLSEIAGRIHINLEGSQFTQVHWI